MLKKLIEVENNLEELLLTSKLHTMFIDYHHPYVKRIWFQYGDYRVFLHKIYSCLKDSQALYHPHQWQSAVRILKNSYEMGVGHSSTLEAPKTDCKLILAKNSAYEMLDADAWHYVNPIHHPVFSLMVTGNPNKRPMPVEPKKEFRKLTHAEYAEIFYEVTNYYDIDLTITNIDNDCT